MIEKTGPDWARIRMRYEETQDTVDAICADAGISLQDLHRQRRKEKWRRANPRPFPPPPRRPRSTANRGPDGEIRRTDTPPAAEPAHSDVPIGARLPDASPPCRAAPGALSAAGRRRLLARLVAAISMKLEQLERRMTNDLAGADSLTATEHERETRAIATLIDNLEKITEMETGIDNATPRRGSAPVDTLADEAERCRRELAQRLSRLVEAAEKQP